MQHMWHNSSWCGWQTVISAPLGALMVSISHISLFLVSGVTGKSKSLDGLAMYFQVDLIGREAFFPYPLSTA
jgi:hypothetical protein